MAKFQPTRPLRGATILIFTKLLGTKISTHAPLAGRDPFEPEFFFHLKISTHAPLAGRDAMAMCRRKKNYLLFQPTRPLRGATRGVVQW